MLKLLKRAITNEEMISQLRTPDYVQQKERF